jgi:GntR family transcriptional regulator/MocR family aminotransferase
MAASVHIPGADEPALVAACRDAGVMLDGITPHRVAPGPSGLLISFAAVPRRGRRPRRRADRSGE